MLSQFVRQSVRTLTYFTHKCLYKMGSAYLFAENGKCHITFRYVNKEFNVDRTFNFARNLDEKVDVCLERIKTNVLKEFTKKTKKLNKKQEKKEEPSTVTPPVVEVSLQQNEIALQGVLFSDIINIKDPLSLHVIDNKFSVVFNSPWVVELKMPTSILVNFPVYPAKLLLQYADRQSSDYIWYRGKPHVNEALIDWTEVGRGFLYTPRNDDEGYLLKLKCTPKNDEIEGPAFEGTSKYTVKPDPGKCPMYSRHERTKQRVNGLKFRVVSYNLLADMYADSDYSRKELFPYCPPTYLDIDYRKLLFIAELQGFNADIMCLCEVDLKIFDMDLCPTFEQIGYHGVYQMKGTTNEGLATFYSNRFEMVKQYGLNIGENIAKLAEFTDIWENIQTNTELQERIVGRSQAIQVTVLRMKEHPDRLLVVANTHLYFHPDADHIRLLQAGLCMRYVEKVYNETRDEHTDSKVAIVFCGDFNSVPECGIYKMMTEGHVPDDFIDWRSNTAQEVKNLTLKQPFQIKSAYPPDTPFTNYTPLFTATLDWIFYQSDQLRLEEFVPLPKEEELQINNVAGIPNALNPSDHLSLVATLEWIGSE